MHTIHALIAIVPPEEIRRKIDELRSKHYPESVKRYPPHITLFGRVPIKTSTEQIANKLSQVCTQFAPIQLSITGYGILPHPVRRLYVSATPNPALEKLYHAVAAELKNDLELEKIRSHFFAHITISKRLLPTEARMILKELERHQLKASFLVRDLVFFAKPVNEEIYQEVAKIPLRDLDKHSQVQ